MFQSAPKEVSIADQQEVDRMYFESMESELKVNLDEEVPAPPVSLSFGTASKLILKFVIALIINCLIKGLWVLTPSHEGLYCSAIYNLLLDTTTFLILI